MKTLILILSVLISSTAFSQKPDSAKVIALEKKLGSFTPIIKYYVGKVENSSNLDSVKHFANVLEEKSNALILEVKAAYNFNDDYMAGYASDMALSVALPELATYYQTSAIMKMSAGLDQKKPGYFTALVNISDNAQKLSKARKFEKVKKRSQQIVKSYQELVAFTSESL